MKNVKLSSKVTVGQYLKIEKDDDRIALAELVRDRFRERYFQPIEKTAPEDRHGFAIMAICCLVIETLEAFYQGKKTTKNCSKEMFTDFFNRHSAFRNFRDDWFYGDIRCGILHEGEARGGWKISRKGKLLDLEQKRINATKFMRELSQCVDDYATLLPDNEDLRGKCKIKMQAICANCE